MSEIAEYNLSANALRALEAVAWFDCRDEWPTTGQIANWTKLSFADAATAIFDLHDLSLIGRPDGECFDLDGSGVDYLEERGLYPPADPVPHTPRCTTGYVSSLSYTRTEADDERARIETAVKRGDISRRSATAYKAHVTRRETWA